MPLRPVSICRRARPARKPICSAQVDYIKAAYLARPEKKNVGTAPLAYDGARGRTGQRRARRALPARAHRIDGAAVVALTLAARPAPAGTSSNSSGPPRLRASVTR